MKTKIGVIGLGYVGLPLIKEFIARGFPVCGFDIDQVKIDMLLAGKSYIKHIPEAEIRSWLERGNFQATRDFSKLAETGAILICVPTPLNANREPDLSYVVNSTRVIAEYLQDGQLVVLESTTYPCTTDEVLLPILEAGGKKVGRDFFLAFSPEREDPGNRHFTTATIPKVVGGCTPACLEKAVELYREIVKVVPVSSTRVAEASKILENTYRAVNIALVNELKMLFERMNIDIWEVIAAASSKPFGFQPFYPGPGLGGHCIPIDPFYLTWKAREYDFSTRFIELAGEINTFQPYYVISRVCQVLNQAQKALNGSRILILGMAYKKDIDDVRESPSLKIFELLSAGGARVDYYDPYIPETGPHRTYPDLRIKSVAYDPERIRDYDLVLLLTDHSDLPYSEIEERARLIVDTRNVFKSGSAKVFQA